MPNHFHLALRPHGDGDLGRWMQWLLTAHTRRDHRHYGTTGHVWQGGFKAFPLRDDDHLAAVLRYVERNPVRAESVARAEHWKWSSLPGWLSADDWLLWRDTPTPRDAAWWESVNEPLSSRFQAATCSDCGIRCCVVGRSATTPGRALPPRLWAWNPVCDRQEDRRSLETHDVPLLCLRPPKVRNSAGVTTWSRTVEVNIPPNTTSASG